MKHTSLILVASLILPASVHAGDTGTKQTIAYVQKLQTESGGFRTHEPRPDAVKVLPTLRATSSSIRALKYFGGELPRKEAVIKFVESCWDADTGAFADVPKGKPDVFTTAVGLMAIVELKMPTEKYIDPASKYLTQNAKAFEEVRLAAAGFEAINKKAPKAKEWAEQIRRGQNVGELTFGKGSGQARDTASSIVTLHRLLGRPAFATDYLKVLDAGQRKNGGWGKADSDTASDLETTYRVMRYYHMLNARPGNVDGVRSFVAKCRNEDGGYALMPGQPSTASGTYFAAIVMYWLKAQ